MTLYISGPIKGYPDKNRTAFDQAETKLHQLGIGAINPLNASANDIEFTDYCAGYYNQLKIDITELLKCDGLLLLENWELSKGARIEVAVATQLQMPTYLLFDDDLVPQPVVVDVDINPVIPSYLWQELKNCS